MKVENFGVYFAGPNSCALFSNKLNFTGTVSENPDELFPVSHHLLLSNIQVLPVVALPSCFLVLKKKANISPSASYIAVEICKSLLFCGRYVFPCRQWIPLSPDKNDAVRLECKSSEKPRMATIRGMT